MDYFDILKRAWNITWRYKALWVLGLFAGASSSGGSSGGGTNYNTGSGDFSTGQLDSASRWFEQNLLAVAIVAGLLVMIGFVFFILSIAAQGGLVYGANEGAEERRPSLRAAWGVGFNKWGRTFMTGFMLGLPVVVVVLVMIGLFIALGVGGAAAGDGAGVGAALGGMCVVLPVFVVVIIALSFIVSVVYQLALRYGVLQDVTFGAAIKRGWDDLWGKKGAVVFWLVMLLPGIVFGLVMVLPILLFIIPATVLFMAEQYVIAGGLGVLMILVMMVPSAIYGTFVSSAWTVFFRKMTGMEPAAAPRPVNSYAPPVPPAYSPPAPPAYAPPAPPVTAEPQPTAGGPIVDVEVPAADEPTEETPPADV